MSRRKETQEDAEEMARRKFLAICRFKVIGRKAQCNYPWLQGAIEDVSRDQDVHLRIKTKIEQSESRKLIDFECKVMLNKPLEMRTDEEKNILFKKIGDNKCFKRYSNNLRKRLASVAVFRYFGPNRVIVRENAVSEALYYIVSGHLRCDVLRYDPVLEVEAPTEVERLNPGDCFGDREVLHTLKRPATVTTITGCEFIIVTKEVFDDAILETVEEDWIKVREAMAVFTYFDSYDEVALREGCIYAKMKTYNRDEILLGDGHGVENHAYFVLSGECQLIENMKVKIGKSLGKTSFTLIREDVSKETKETGNGETIEAKYFKAPPKSTVKMGESVNFNYFPSKASWTSVAKADKSIQFDPSPSYIVRHHNPSSHVMKVEKMEDYDLHPEPVITLFMQVCLFRPESTFGLGENMKNRRIVALTETVECLLLPNIWLLERNTANIWTRIKHFMEKKIPSTRILFKEFVSKIRWREWQSDVIDDVIKNMHTVNFTTKHDVPYSIRVMEPNY